MASLNWKFAQRFKPETELKPFEALKAHWDELQEGEEIQVLKENRLRTVFLHEMREYRDSLRVSWVLKKFRHRGWYNNLRHRFFPSHAEREFKALEKFYNWGYPVPRPLAFALRKKGSVPVEGALIMEEIPQTRVLAECFEGCYDRGMLLQEHELRVRSWLVACGQLVRSIHEKGVRHPDLHGGNFLLREGEGDELFLIDFHSCYFPGYLSHAAKIKGIAMVGQSLRASLQDREFRWFLLGYLKAGWDPDEPKKEDEKKREEQTFVVDPQPYGLNLSQAWPKIVDELPKDEVDSIQQLETEVKQCVARLDARKMRSRTKRCLLNASVFERTSNSLGKVYKRRDFDLQAALSALKDDPPESTIKSKPQAWVARVQIPGLEFACVIKYRQYSGIRSLLSPFFTHPLKKAWIGAHGMLTRGLPAPLGQALIEKRNWIFVTHSWLIQKEFEGESLDQFLWKKRRGTSEALSTYQLRNLVRTIGQALSQLHAQRVRHRDLSPQNLLVQYSKDSDQPLLCWVDQDDVSFPIRVGRNQIERNLVQLGNMPEGHISTSLLMRALRAYDGGSKKFYNQESIASLRESLLDEALKTITRMTELENRSSVEDG